MDKHAWLNTRNDQEFAAGWDDLTIVNAQIHSQGQTPDPTKAISLEEKRDWLGSLTAGQKELRATVRNNWMRGLLYAHMTPR